MDNIFFGLFLLERDANAASDGGGGCAFEDASVAADAVSAIGERANKFGIFFLRCRDNDDNNDDDDDDDCATGADASEACGSANKFGILFLPTLDASDSFGLGLDFCPITLAPDTARSAGSADFDSSSIPPRGGESPITLVPENEYSSYFRFCIIDGGSKFLTKFNIFFLNPIDTDASSSPIIIPASSLKAASSLDVEYVFDISSIIFD